MGGTLGRRALAALFGAMAMGAAPLSAAAQEAPERCVQPGVPIAPVPWSQHLLAPDRAWPLSTGAGQRVAVVSTGVAATGHLTDAVAQTVDLAPEDDLGQPSGAADCLGVGTGVAGIIAARPVDGVGFRGLAPNANILSAKVIGDQLPTDRPTGSVAPESLTAGIDWAVDQRATVMVVPTITYQDSGELRAAVQRAQAADIVIVASVGDARQDDPPGIVAYPAGYAGVIGVGAIAEDGSAGLSQAGADLVAPGAEIVTTYPGAGLGRASGTAFAAGYVAGTVALVRAYRPELSRDEVAHRLFATATPAREGARSPSYGHGIVNPYHAVVDRVVEGNPAALPSLTPATVSDAERARLAARERSVTLAFSLAAGGLALAAGLAAAVAFGPRGSRRRWRAGLAAVPQDQPGSERPEPMVGLFDRPAAGAGGQK